MRTNHVCPVLFAGLLLGCLSFPCSAGAENWPVWRGPRTDGTSLEKNVPKDWDVANAIWKTIVPGVGHASPIVWGDRVFTVTAMPEKLDRMLLCFDRATGEILWQQIVAHGPLEKINRQNSYASGTPATDGKQVYVVFRVGENIVVAAHDPVDGKQLWRVQPGTHTGEWGFSNEPILFSDKVIRPDGSGNVTETHVAWRDDEGAPYVPSMIVAGNFLLGVNNTGIAFCYEAATGDVYWRERLGKHHASPVLIDGLVYFINDDGQVNVIKPSKKFQRVARYELGEPCYASPAISDGQVFLRGFKHLFCIGRVAADVASDTDNKPGNPEPAVRPPQLAEIRTASNHILVAYFKSPNIGAIDTSVDKWRLNNQAPLEISKWITPKWDGVDFEYEHHIYLRYKESFVQKERYTLASPHGTATFVFDETQVYCESIKTNQSAYSALSTTRFANFAVWTANGRVERIEGPLPRYEVIEIKSGQKISAGVLEEVGPNENSGDFVYRMDLSDVPAGGPYKIAVKGFGSSFPFGIGGTFSDRLAYISFRGLLHERCGMEQKKPYFDHDIRDACHTRVYVTDSEPREAKVTISRDDPIIEVHGGYHDAGDCDRRDHHMMAPILLLSMYDAFPKYFSDRQFNIPDQFDERYAPIGKGNGIPDIIDEAEWGTLIFEYLQEESGGVRSGIERNGYPTNGPTVDKDTAKYGTFRVSAQSTNLAAGLFAHLSRVLKPYKPERAEQLRRRAERAWAFAGHQAQPAHKLYYYTQYYLLTGDKEAHEKLLENAAVAQEYLVRHEHNPRSIHEGKIVFGAHFVSYLLDNEREKDPRITRIFEQAIRTTADKTAAELVANPYPNGTSNPNRWWGSQTAQGQYAESCILQWRLTGEQKYIDSASVLMDYNQGLNPVGKCYLTGIGFDRTWDPLHHDSYAMKSQGWGPAPGLQVFGPGNLRQINRGFVPMFPDVHTLPAQRQFVDHRKYVSVTEFTIPESLAFPAAIYTVLSEGCKWDGVTDPYRTTLF